MNKRRSFLKTIAAGMAFAVAPIFKGLSKTIAEPDLVLTFFSPGRFCIGNSDPTEPPKNPRASKYWYNAKSGKMFGFEQDGWRQLASGKGKEIVFSAKNPIGHFFPESPMHLAEEAAYTNAIDAWTSNKWTKELPELDERAFIAECESCHAPIDLRTWKFRSRIEQLPNGGLWEHIDHVWDNIPIEVLGVTRDYRLCENCLKNATLTYDL